MLCRTNRLCVPTSDFIYATLSDRFSGKAAEGKAKIMAAVRTLTGNLPKGSSFRYLLNGIYARLGVKITSNHHRTMQPRFCRVVDYR